MAWSPDSRRGGSLGSVASAHLDDRGPYLVPDVSISRFPSGSFRRVPEKIRSRGPFLRAFFENRCYHCGNDQGRSSDRARRPRWRESLDMGGRSIRFREVGDFTSSSAIALAQVFDPRNETPDIVNFLYSCRQVSLVHDSTREGEIPGLARILIRQVRSDRSASERHQGVGDRKWQDQRLKNLLMERGGRVGGTAGMSRHDDVVASRAPALSSSTIGSCSRRRSLSRARCRSVWCPPSWVSL